MKNTPILTISELTRHIKATLEPAYADLWIEGEISNLKIPSSGHFYFTLKDKKSQIRAVMFKFKNKALKYTPEDGMKVVCKCRINVYEPRGEYQLLIENMTPRGIGDLQFAFEQLKKKLEKEGLFKSEKKKKIPFLPEKIAVITSPSGAAVRDIINIITRRFSNMEILIIPVKVQGDMASLEIEDALKTVNKSYQADVIILGRGGGSIEDLWAFNEERVARAIYNSDIPVISAVGHETDFTISDFVADLRAPTPSAAAELAVKEKEKLQKQVMQTTSRLRNFLLQTLEKNRMKLNHCHSLLLDPAKMLSDLRLKTDDLSIRLTLSINHLINLKKAEVKSAQKIVFSASPSNMIKNKRERLYFLTKNLSGNFTAAANNKRLSLKTCITGLNSFNPLHTLERGFSITKLLPSLKTIKDSSNLDPGDRINIRFAKGSAECEVVKLNT